jgi:predicted RNA binding protein YcfA (HicA-like mRNA interferase family)
MPKYTKLPPITGKQLIKLLGADGWREQRRTRHGIGLAKNIGGRTRVTLVKYTADPIPDGTLSDILGPQQTAIGKRGLLELANKYGI